MAITYSDAQISLEQNNWFKSRVRQAVSIFNNYLLNATTDDPLYEAKISTATRIGNQIEQVMNTMMFTLAGDSEVMAGGPAIPDNTLQMIVEKTLQKFWPVTATPAMPGMGMIGLPTKLSSQPPQQVQ